MAVAEAQACEARDRDEKGKEGKVAGQQSRRDSVLHLLQQFYGAHPVFASMQAARIESRGRTTGYTFRDEQFAVAVIPGAAVGTLFHELFHLVVRSTFADIPQWLDEGVAALYEVSEIDGADVLGVRNWRGPVLLDLWSRRHLLREVIGADWFVSDTPGGQFCSAGAPPSSRAVAAQFAVARYFALYLQEKGKLAAVFARVKALEPREGVAPASAALGAVVAELGPIEAVQAHFRPLVSDYRATHC